MKFVNLAKRSFMILSILLLVFFSFPYKASATDGSCDIAYPNTIVGPGLCICPSGTFKFPTGGALPVWAPSYGPLPDPNGGPCKGCDNCFYMLPVEFDQYCQEWNQGLVKCHDFNREVAKNARQPIKLGSSQRR